MEQTDVHAMQPSDTRAGHSTKWVLASAHDSYIAYTYAYEQAMGIKGVRPGKYTLLWLDTVNGKSARQDNVVVAEREVKWQKPAAFGAEVALHAKRVGN